MDFQAYEKGDAVMNGKKMYLKLSEITLSLLMALLVILLVPLPARAEKKVQVSVLVSENYYDYEGHYKYSYYTSGKLKGLLKKASDGNGADMVIKYQSPKQFKQIFFEYGSGGYETKNEYKYDRKGRTTKVKAGKSTLTLAYNAKGLIGKTRVSGAPYGNGTVKYAYNNKKLCTKAVFRQYVKRFEYDNKKNITKITQKWTKGADKGLKETYIFKNEYSKGRLVKRSYLDEGEITDIKYKYKTMTVSNKMAKVIKKQQQNLLNNGNIYGGPIRQEIIAAFPYVNYSYIW